MADASQPTALKPFPRFQSGVRWRRLFHVGRERSGSQFGIRRWKQRRDAIYASEARDARHP